MRDVAITGGRIAAVEANLAAADAASTIDAAGKLVVPGLIDVHAHVRSKEMPSICLSHGVTSMLDGGSRASTGSTRWWHAAKVGAQPRARAAQHRPHRDPDARGRAERHQPAWMWRALSGPSSGIVTVIVGVKARLSRSVAGANDLEALRRAQAIVAPTKLPVMVHMGDTVSPLPAILALLKPGDIVTHLYAPPPHGIFDERGRVLPEVIAARKRGIWFDVGHGRIAHITWAEAERGLKQGFVPDTISTDLNETSLTDQVFDFPNVLSKFLLLGVPLDQVIAMATSNAARAVVPFKDLGTLRVGATADVTILELREGKFEFVDNENTKRTGKQKLFATAAVVGGKKA